MKFLNFDQLKMRCIAWEVVMNECVCVEKVDINQVLKDLKPVLEALSENPIRDYADRYK